MNTLFVVIGFILLVAGHQSSWLFVGGISFIVGSLIADQVNFVHNEIERIIFSFTSSILGSLLVVYLKKILVILATFISGGYVVMVLPQALGWDTSWINWIYILAAAIASALITLLWGSLPVILITSLVGATLIAQHIQIGTVSPLGLFIVLLVFGLVAQWLLWHYGKADTEE
jgi:hypothetical protein